MVRWEQWHGNLYAYRGDAVSAFAVIGACEGKLEGLWSVRIIRPGGDLYGRYASVEKAKAHVELWARRHWRTVK